MNSIDVMLMLAASTKNTIMIKVNFPSNLKQVITDKVVTPLLQHPHTDDWHRAVTSKLSEGKTFDSQTKNYHRKELLGQGQADFTTSIAGLTTDDLALLYSFYYFQMHFSSSVALYCHFRTRLVEIFKSSEKIIFVDIGCGPATSGLAFLTFTRLRKTIPNLRVITNKPEIIYYGIDNSKSMCSLANNILASYDEATQVNEYRFNTRKQLNSYVDIPNLVDKQSDHATIILNCCYFFASTSIDVDEFTATIQKVVDSNPKSKILLFYQNAPSSSPQIVKNYLTFRDTVQGLKTDGTNIQQLVFSFEDEFNSSNYSTINRKVSFQLLKNY